jgi:hypothetical protein
MPVRRLQFAGVKPSTASLMQRLGQAGTTEPFLGSTPDRKGVQVLPFGVGRKKTLGQLSFSHIYSYGFPRFSPSSLRLKAMPE